MKEIIPNLQLINDIKKDSIEIVEKFKKEYKLIDTYKRTKGLLLWTYNPSTGLLNKCPVENRNILKWDVIKGKLQPIIENHKSFINPDEILFEALNKESAVKRLQKYLSGQIKDLCNLKKPGTISFY